MWVLFQISYFTLKYRFSLSLSACKTLKQIELTEYKNHCIEYENYLSTPKNDTSLRPALPAAVRGGNDKKLR